MKKILFKGKRIDDGEWIKGYYVKHGLRHWIYTGEIKYMYYPALADLPTKYEVDPETVCRYTGYTDLRKRKVFEHDIVFHEDDEYYGHIVFDEGKFLIKWEESGNYLKSDINFWFTQRRMYIVGNIFDNPNLIGGFQKC